jgi:hypothetical protein
VERGNIKEHCSASRPPGHLAIKKNSAYRLFSANGARYTSLGPMPLSNFPLLLPFQTQFPAFFVTHFELMWSL